MRRFLSNLRPKDRSTRQLGRRGASPLPGVRGQSPRKNNLPSKYPNLFIILVLLLPLLVACGRKDSAWEHAQATGTLRVGLDPTYPPFENVAPDGSLDGFDVDLAHAIGERLGLEIEFVGISFDGLYDALIVGRADVLISALTVSNDQAGRVLYSIPYFNAGEMLVAPADSGIASMEDLDGGVLAVEYGAGGDVEGRAWQRRLDSLEMMRLPGVNEALGAAESGEADAALVDSISALLAVDDYPSLATVDYVTEELFAAAVRRDSEDLLAELNRVLQEMHDDGTIAALMEKWF